MNYLCRVCRYPKARILQHNIHSIPATRERLPGEITPESATQSCTYDGNEDQYAAEHAIDLDLGTYSMTCARPDGTTWFQLKLDQVHCVEQVREYNTDGSARRTWTCSNTDCSNCEGYSCGDCSLTVSSEETVKCPVLDCKYGDTVKLQYTGRAYNSLKEYEILMTGEKGDISLVKVIMFN